MLIRKKEKKRKETAILFGIVKIVHKNVEQAFLLCLFELEISLPPIQQFIYHLQVGVQGGNVLSENRLFRIKL